MFTTRVTERLLIYMVQNHRLPIIVWRLFFATAEELGMEVKDEYIREAAYRSTMGSHQQTEALLDLDDPPTCIIYPDDFACFGGISAIRERDMNIPEDISIVGYDGIKLGRRMEPKLTTLRQDTTAIGEKAANKLLSLIEKPKTTLIEVITVEGDVYEGASVKKI